MSSSVEINVVYTLRKKCDGKTVNKTLEKKLCLLLIWGEV